MVRANKSMLPTAAKQNAKKQEGIAKATSAFNTYLSDVEKKYAEIGINKSQALKGYLSDSGALGFKAFMMNKDTANTIQAKLIINSIKKWGGTALNKGKELIGKIKKDPSVPQFWYGIPLNKKADNDPKYKKRLDKKIESDLSKKSKLAAKKYAEQGGYP
jgi:hypothetical protein